MSYIFSNVLSAFLTLAVGRMRRDEGVTLLLEGPAGGGKTSFAQALAERLGAKYFRHQCHPDRERPLLYSIDVGGVLRRDNAWVRGPAWRAFEASREGPVVLLIDELDKANPGMDAFLLELLELFEFEDPNGNLVQGNKENILVVLTSNGRRRLRPEVLRRCQRINVPLPENGRLHRIVRQIAGVTIPDGLLDLAIRIGDAVRSDDEENAPSPKELALLCYDLLALAHAGEEDLNIWREVAASYLTKNGGPSHLDRVNEKFNWARALRTEAGKN